MHGMILPRCSSMFVKRVNGKRVLVTHKPVYNFYYQDPRGKARSVYGEPLTEVRCANSKDFKKNVAINRKTGRLYETDINPLNKTLAQHYEGAESNYIQHFLILR